MSDLETPTPDSGEVDLRELCADLRQQNTWLLGALVVISLTLTAYIGLQATRSGRELDGLRPQALQIAERNKQEEPFIQNLLGRLLEYSRAHPDFAATLAKYQIRQVTNAPAATPVAPATPAATSAAPKK